MIGRVVEIAEDGRHLSLSRGFMVVQADGAELGRVPLDDIAVVIANAHGITYSNNLMVALAERGACVVLCGANHSPVAWVWPLIGHHAQAARMRAQLDAPRPLDKRLWQALVRAKIENQGSALATLGRPSGGFRLLARRVASGDPENLEGQAARRYWPLLFGPDFRRDRMLSGINSLLNYGYTVLRAATARATVAAGLHPSVGIHHRTRTNDMCLVDDLMEPFRPLVDIMVARLAAGGIGEVTPEAKRVLAGLTTADMGTRQGTTPLATCLERLAASLGQSYETGKVDLDLPLAPLPLELAAPEAADGA
ncbi:MAG: type II CRISPR-associated endonuclease Cas1 [Alphaproteobacteria bacterium]